MSHITYSHFYMKSACLRFCVLSLILPASLLADTPVVQSTLRGKELRNDIVSLEISTNTELLSCLEIATETDIAAHDHKKISSVKIENGRKIDATKVTLSGFILLITIDHETIDVDNIANKDYFTFEVLSLGICHKVYVPDDVGYLGAKAIAYDQIMVYNGFRIDDIDKIPA